MFTPLKHRQFRLLFSAQVLSDLGNWLDFVALNTLIVYTWAMGPEAVAALVTTVAIPWVVIGPLVSVFADRLPRRMIMVLCDLMRVLIAVGLFFAPNLYVLLVLVFLKGCFGAFFDPARQGAIRMIVPEDLLPKALALSQFSVQSTKILAPVLGAAFISITGPRMAFLVEGAGFLLSAILLFFLPALQSEREEAGDSDSKPSFWSELRAGWTHVMTSRLLLVSIISMACVVFINFLYDGLFALWTKHLSLDETEFGMVLSAIGFGSVIGAVLIGQWGGWQKRPLAVMCLAALMCGCMVALMGLGGVEVISGSMVFWFCVFFVIGVAGTGAFIPFGYLMQRETPPHLMGRVAAIANAIQNTSMLVAPSVGALLSKVYGVGNVFLGAGLGMMLVGLVVLVIHPRLTAVSSKDTASLNG